MVFFSVEGGDNGIELSNNIWTQQDQKMSKAGVNRGEVHYHLQVWECQNMGFNADQ